MGNTGKPTLRMHSLDYLRGLCAVGIMSYHYTNWTIGGLTAGDLLCRIGIYGVSVFYILSGLTLQQVYSRSEGFQRATLGQFAVKRLFRIYPLLWVATMLSIWLTGQEVSKTDLLLNFTGLFGLISWNAAIATGAWSIGNELVFYGLFPILHRLSRKKPIAITSFFLLTLAYAGYIAFVRLDPAGKLSEQWIEYIDPLNQFYLFAGGFVLGHFTDRKSLSPVYARILLCLGALLFWLYPADGNPIVLVSGINRLIFSTSCFMLCLGFHRGFSRWPEVLHQPFHRLGEACYSVYMLHPLVFLSAGLIIHRFDQGPVLLPDTYQAMLCFPITILFGWFNYRLFEKRFISWGNRVVAFFDTTSSSMSG